MKFLIEFSSMCPLVDPLFRWPVEKYQIFSCVYVYVMFVTFVLLDFPFKSSSNNISNHLPPYPYSLTILFLFFTFSDNTILRCAHAQHLRTIFSSSIQRIWIKGSNYKNNNNLYRMIEQLGWFDITFKKIVRLLLRNTHSYYFEEY